MSWFTSKSKSDSEFNQRSIPGVPSVFTGRDTTIGEMREMATDIRDKNATTQTERGLAISVLAILDMFEKEET